MSTTINGISMTITPNGANFDGAYYKFGYTNPVSHLGEHVLQQGISTESSGKSITLTLKGLSAGTHTLLTYHNSYNTPTNTAKIAVTVNGASAVSVCSPLCRLSLKPHRIVSDLSGFLSGYPTNYSSSQFLDRRHILRHLYFHRDQPDHYGCIHSQWWRGLCLLERVRNRYLVYS